MSRGMRIAAVVALGLTGVLAAAPAATSADDPAAGQKVEPRQLDVNVVIPDETGIEVTNAELLWAVNLESGAGAFAGGCNFLSAGVAGDTGRSRVWTQADGFYRAQEGNARIEKPDASGRYAPATWDTKCLDRDGRPVTAASTSSSSENRVALTGGRGSVDPRERTATIRWRGSFTVVFYGGMTYWSATDPVLTVDADGTGLLTATASGYGASMADPGLWLELRPTTVTLARLTGVRLDSKDSEKGFTATPAYIGVSVDVPDGGTAQAKRDEVNAPYWGSFPQDFVDFQVRTGQASYWYTSGGARDRAKPALPLVVSYDASEPFDAPTTPPPDGGSDGGQGAGAPAPPVLSPAPAGSSRPVTGGSSPPATRVSAAGVDTADGDDPGAGAFPASTASTVLAARPLIPVATAPARSALLSDPVLWSAAGVLALGALAVAGFLKGWLVLPWAR